MVGLAICAIALASASCAAAQTFGDDLSLAPNVNLDCSVYPTPYGSFQGGQSCTWSTPLVPLEIPGDPAGGGGAGNPSVDGLLVPQSTVDNGAGTVTAVRVRVGASTGPMRVVVLEAIRNPNGPPYDPSQPGTSSNDVGCCLQVGQSQVFTPAPGTVTTIPVDFAVKNDLQPEQGGLYVFDMLGLSVLEDGVQIPVYFTGSETPNDPNDLIEFPAAASGSSTMPDDAFGFELVMNADWTPGIVGNVQSARSLAAAASAALPWNEEPRWLWSQPLYCDTGARLCPART